MIAYYCKPTVMILNNDHISYYKNMSIDCFDLVDYGNLMQLVFLSHPENKLQTEVIKS